MSKFLDFPSKSIIGLSRGAVEEGCCLWAHWKRVKRGVGEESNLVKRVCSRGGVGLIPVLFNADSRCVGEVMVRSSRRSEMAAQSLSMSSVGFCCWREEEGGGGFMRWWGCAGHLISGFPGTDSHDDA